MDRICFLPASQLAQAIHEGECSSEEVVQAFLQQIDRHNVQVNAVVTLDREVALARAREADAALAHGEVWGPLHGVPVTIKDVFATAHLRTTSGFRPLAGYIPEEDAAVVARLRGAGAIILGKTNAPELANDEQTSNPIFGRTVNPWDPSRTPGGSSGGSAAALAAGLTALDVGSDIGGSVRNPAAFCGVYSLKPTDTRVPFRGHIPPPPGVAGRGLLRQFLTPGPLARSVQDLRLALGVIAGPLDEQWEVPPVPLDSPSPKPLAQLHIAWSDDFGLPVAAEIRAGLASLADQLTRAGCRVERANPPDMDFSRAIYLYGLLKQAAFSVRGTPLGLPHFAWRALSAFAPAGNPIARGLIRGAGVGLKEYALALSERDGFIAKMEKFLAGWDAWICPVAACLPYPHIASDNIFKQLSATVEVDSRPIPYILATSYYTTPFNLTGNPVVVLPLAHPAGTLPVGVQVIGRRWSDMALLNVAEALAPVTGPFQAPPGF